MTTFSLWKLLLFHNINCQVVAFLFTVIRTQFVMILEQSQHICHAEKVEIAVRLFFYNYWPIIHTEVLCLGCQRPQCFSCSKIYLTALLWMQFTYYNFYVVFGRYATASARSDGMFLLCGGRDTSGMVWLTLCWTFELFLIIHVFQLNFYSKMKEGWHSGILPTLIF